MAPINYCFALSFLTEAVLKYCRIVGYSDARGSFARERMNLMTLYKLLYKLL